MARYPFQQIILMRTSPPKVGTDHGFAIMPQFPADG